MRVAVVTEFCKFMASLGVFINRNAVLLKMTKGRRSGCERQLVSAHAGRGDYVPRFYAYYYKQWMNYEMPYHQHDSTEIMYMISGVCRIDVKAGDTEKSVILKKGEFMVLDAGVPHRLIVDQAASCRMLNVEFGFMESEGRRHL